MFSNEFIGFWRLWEEWKMMTSENVITIFLRFIVIRSPPMRPSLRGYLLIPSIFRIWQLSLLYLRQLLTDWLSVYTWPDFFGLHADGGWLAGSGYCSVALDTDILYIVPSRHTFNTLNWFGWAAWLIWLLEEWKIEISFLLTRSYIIIIRETNG